MDEKTLSLIGKEFAGTKVEEHLAPELLGGAVIEWDDWQIDASVRGRLQKLASSLKAY
jgi:F0F1-type ATP synthase delta subunit